MGYALFTARKLALNSRVNTINAKLMSISNERYALTQKINGQQMAQSMRTSAATLQAIKAYKESDAQGDFNQIMKEAEAQNEYDTASNTELFKLQQKDSLLDTQQKTLETQLKAAQQELEAVEKAEESAIKNATPKYVG